MKKVMKKRKKVLSNQDAFYIALTTEIALLRQEMNEKLDICSDCKEHSEPYECEDCKN